MKLVSFVSLMALSLGACATQPATPQPAAAHSQPARSLELPSQPGPGQPRELRVLLDEPVLKLASIILRAGTVLPLHDSKVPVVIMALEGQGVVVVGEERLPLDPAHAVYLEAKVPHAVEPAAGTDLVLLVHHLGRASEHHP